MKILHWTHLGLLLCLLWPSQPATASAELARSKFCMTCHGYGGTIVGPGYHAIAERRRLEPDAEQLMAERIRAGSQGEWGQTPMPANAVSAEEALELARWILSLER